MTDITALAALISPTSPTSSSRTAQPPELGFHQGVVVTWNSLDNTNLITVGGEFFENLPVLATSDSVFFLPGTIVGILRFRSTYFILGRIALPGLTNSLGLQFDEVVDTDTKTAAPGFVFGDLNTTFGPSITVEIGSSLRALVLISTQIGVGNGPGILGGIGVQLTGATTSSPAPELIIIYNDPDAGGTATYSTMLMFTDNELNGPGSTTFTLKYFIDAGPIDFSFRRLIVWPL